ncbi:unnamed protein product [Enterobius vermicularis]|uniref:Galectin n=1 Tax=Enterobius vermicularis TaxID=51028 RepID=A0A0N4VBK0_ENTVE|nr:unnamed protein product [Enterobius vermicularis]
MIGFGARANFRDQFHPPTPYETWLRGFTAGNRIRVVGISGPEARRFAERAVVRNSTKYGAWQQEERQESTFPFQKDSFFTVDLLAGANEVAVNVNGTYHCTFTYRDDPRAVTTLNINGDIRLHNVQVFA